MSTQKLTHDELFQQEKLRLRNEEEKKRHELEDRLRAVTTTKDELEVGLRDSASVAIASF